jgi:hypothetical protein
LVSTTSTSLPIAKRRCTTTVLRAVTDEAKELTTSRIRKPLDRISSVIWGPEMTGR